MDNAPLSQDEIDALLNAASGDFPEPELSAPPEPDNGPISEVLDEPKVVAAPVEFERMDEDITSLGVPESVALIFDVPMEITVELGGARKTVKEILALNPGSVVELDRQSGEPVDILVNGKLLARGEVVVIDENFGVRVSEIVNKAERLTGIK